MSKEAEKGSLTVRQEQVISLLLSGESQRNAASEVGIAEETVSRWKHEAVFVAELGQRQAELWAVNAQRLRNLGSQALDALAAVLLSGSETAKVKAALAVLRSQGLLELAKPAGPTTVEEAKKAWRESPALDAWLKDPDKHEYKG